MPERDLCAGCVWEAMAAKARAAPPPRPRQYRSPDDDPGEAIAAAEEGGGGVRGWDTPPAIRAAMQDPIGPGTPLRVLEALRDDAAVRATVFPDAELARQALELLIRERTIPDREAERRAAAAGAEEGGAEEGGVVVDDSGDCLGCQ